MTSCGFFKIIAFLCIGLSVVGWVRIFLKSEWVKKSFCNFILLSLFDSQIGNLLFQFRVLEIVNNKLHKRLVNLNFLFCSIQRNIFIFFVSGFFEMKLSDKNIGQSGVIAYSHCHIFLFLCFICSQNLQMLTEIILYIW